MYSCGILELCIPFMKTSQFQNLCLIRLTTDNSDYDFHNWHHNTNFPTAFLTFSPALLIPFCLILLEGPGLIQMGERMLHFRKK